MSLNSKVAWKDGMFLLPQHFQQAERSLESALRLQVFAPQPLMWGVLELELNEPAVSEGRLELLRCRAILPDGTPVEVPGVDLAPPSAALRSGSGSRVIEVFLTLPARRSGTPLVAADPEQALVRFVEKLAEVPDDHEPDRVQTIEVATKNLRLAIGADGLDGKVALKLAEVEGTAEGRLALRRDYVPPCPVIAAAPYLVRQVQDLLGRMSAKVEELTEGRRQRDNDALEFNAADIKNFWLLHTLNQHLWVLRQLLLSSATHPARLFEELLRLFGGLLVFSPRASMECPTYYHEAIGASFSALLGRLYELLGVVVRQQYRVIELTQSRNVWDGRIDDPRLLEEGEFYLVATGDVQRGEFERLPSACKIADSHRVEGLARFNNPGLTLEPVPRPRPPVPVRKDAFYFRLHTTGPLWDEIRRSGQIGLFVPRAPDGLKLELVILFGSSEG